MAAIAHLETARREKKIDLELLHELGNLGREVPPDQLALSLTDSQQGVKNLPEPRAYAQRPQESRVNFELRLLFRQGAFAFQHPSRFAVIRKEALLYALLGPKNFLETVRSNRLSPLAYSSTEGGIYEWVSEILLKIERNGNGKFREAEVKLFEKLEQQLRGISAKGWAAFLSKSMDCCCGRK